MNQEHHGQFASFVSGLLLGAAIGTVTAILLAPQSGRKTRRNIGRAAVGTRKRIEKSAAGTRKRIGKAAVEIRKSTGDRLDDLADEFKGKVDDAITGARKRLSSD